MKMNKELIREIRESMEIALKEVEEKHGVGINLGNGRYTETSVKLSLEATLLNGVESKEKADWDRLASIYGFKESDYEREVISGQGTLIVVGFNERARKFPVIAEDPETKKRYKMALESVTFKD